MASQSKKCPGVKAKSSPGLLEVRGMMGREFRVVSASDRMVVNSSKERDSGPTIFLRMVFMVLIPASQRPPKWGA